MKTVIVLALGLAVVGGVAGSLAYVATRPSPTEVAMHKFDRGLPALGASLQSQAADRAAVRQARAAVADANAALIDYYISYGVNRSTAQILVNHAAEDDGSPAWLEMYGVAPVTAERIVNGG